MTEKFNSKLNPAGKIHQHHHQNGEKGSSESDKAFLERSHVVPIMRELLENLYNHQPEQPLEYIYT